MGWKRCDRSSPSAGDGRVLRSVLQIRQGRVRTQGTPHDRSNAATAPAMGVCNGFHHDPPPSLRHSTKPTLVLPGNELPSPSHPKSPLSALCFFLDIFFCVQPHAQVCVTHQHGPVHGRRWQFFAGVMAFLRARFSRVYPPVTALD